MDLEISKWILEYTLRPPLDPTLQHIIHDIIPSLPLHSYDTRLQKTLLLHRIDFEVSNAVVSEKLLDLLELIAQLDSLDGHGQTCPDSMKSAYCAVAVDCTARFLDQGCEFNANNEKYLKSVNRVWKDRVCKAEGLVSEEVGEKMEEIVAALWDPQACERIVRVNTRKVALKRVRVYVEEERRKLGPSFLEWVAGKVGKEWERLCNGETQKGWAPLEKKHITVSSKHGKATKSLFVDEETEVVIEKAVKIPASEVDKVSGVIESSQQQAFKKGQAPVEQKCITVKRRHGEGAKIWRVHEETDAITEKAVKIPTCEVHTGSVAMESSPMEMERQASKKSQAPGGQKHIKVKSKHDGGAKIFCVDEETDVITEKAVKIPVPEVHRGPVAIESSPMEMEWQVSKKGRALLEQKHIAVKSKRDEGPKILHVDEETDVITTKAVKILAPEVERAPVAIESSRMEMERQASKKVQAPVGQKDITVKSKHDEGTKILHVDEEADVITGKSAKIPAPEVDRVSAAIESGPMEMEQQASKKVDLSNAQIAQIAQTLPKVMDNNINCESLVENQPHPEMDVTPEEERVQKAPLESNAIESHATVRDPLPDALQPETGLETHASPRANIGETRKHRTVLYRRSPIMVRRKRGTGAKISVVDEEDDILMEESLKTPPPEVDRVPASIQSSPMELHLSKKADLPNAQTAQTAPNVMDTPVENHCSPNKSNALPVRDDETQASSPRTCIDKIDVGSNVGPGTSCPSPRACADSDKENLENIEEMEACRRSSSKKPRLPSPKVNISSFLRKYENRNTVIAKRRTSKKWKPEEEDALRKGVRKYGDGNWKLIWLAYQHVFQVKGRTEVDLKDKWRNMTKGKQRRGN